MYRKMMRPILLDALEELFPDKDWIVHHKDGNRNNNDLLNLFVMTRGEHTGMHSTGRILSEEHKEKIRQSEIIQEPRIVKRGVDPYSGKQRYVIKIGNKRVKSSIDKKKLEKYLNDIL